MNYITIFETANGGQAAGKLDISKTSIDSIIEYAEDNVPGLYIDIPDFEKNVKLAQSKSKIGYTKRKDMPVLTSKDIHQFQSRLMIGSIDIKHPLAPGTDPSDLFPSDLNKSTGKQWLINGLQDGDKQDDIVTVKHEKVKISNLKPIQEQIYADKSINSIYNETKGITIKSTTSFIQNKTFFIVSSDHFILDGHHRWLSGMLIDPNMKVNVMSVDLPIKELLPLMLSYTDAIGNKRNS
jgi:hypothetical protein